MPEYLFRLAVNANDGEEDEPRDIKAELETALDRDAYDFTLSPLPAPPFSREELAMLAECAEITYQSMDRPEPGTPEALGALLTKVRVMLCATSDPAEVKKYADLIMTEIHDDIARGMRNSHGVTIPKYPGSFSAMHEYTDANFYVLDAMGDLALAFDDEAKNALVNAVLDECDRRLLAEYKEACEQVGQETGEDFAANCICARGATHFHAIWPERGCQSPRCEPGCQGYFR